MWKKLCNLIFSSALMSLIEKNTALLDENTILRRENARFLGVVAAKEREIATLKDELRGRDRKSTALKRDCVGRFV